MPHADADMGAAMDDIFANADAFLLGRKTYDIFAGHWPKVTDPDNLVVVKLNTLPKHVASRTQVTFDWSGSEVVRDVVGEVAALKNRYPREIQVHGSAGLAQTLIEHDLIDEYRLLTFPVVHGSGKRLFGSGTIPVSFSLVRSTVTSTGAVISVYRPAGGLRTGTFALD